MVEKTIHSFQEFLSRFQSVTQTNNSHYLARCPAHDDGRPSLRIGWNAQDEKIWVSCYAGCDARDILAKVGLTLADLYLRSADTRLLSTRSSPKKPMLTLANPTKIYSYTDEYGKELYQNCRYETDSSGNTILKEFRQRRQDVNGKWVHTLQGVRKVPYHLPQLLTAVTGFYDCEGEKDVESLEALGEIATDLGKNQEIWKNFLEIGSGKHIIVCEDNDDAGRKSAQARARFWYPVAASVKILHFDDLPEKSDVTDWIHADPEHHDVFALHDRVQRADIYSPLQDVLVDFFYVPSPHPPLVKIMDQQILSAGNLAGVIAGIGHGKSNLMEIFASLVVDPFCEPDSLTEVCLEPDDLCILIDTEQTKDDCFKALQRIWRKTGQKESSLLPNKQHFRQLRIASTAAMDVATRRERLLEALETPSLRLLLLDGVLDFIQNANDIDQCVEFADWLFVQANQRHVGILFTIHGNRNDPTGKGKGWLGAELQRRSEAFLRLSKHPNFPEIRVLSTDFENAKVRHGKDTGLNIAMTWNSEFGAMRCIPYTENGHGPSQDTIFQMCFTQHDTDRLSKKELVNTYQELTRSSKSKTYRDIEQAEGTILVQDTLNGLQIYRLLENEQIF